MASNLVPECRQPQVLLGLDALRRTYRMILRLSKAEVWLEGRQRKITNNSVDIDN